MMAVSSAFGTFLIGGVVVSVLTYDCTPLFVLRLSNVTLELSVASNGVSFIPSYRLVRTTSFRFAELREP